MAQSSYGTQAAAHSEPVSRFEPQPLHSTWSSTIARLGPLHIDELTAFGEFYDAHGPWAQQFATRITGERNDADEIVFEAVLEVSRTGAWRAEPPAVRTALLSIVQRLSVEVLRGRRYRLEIPNAAEAGTAALRQ